MSVRLGGIEFDNVDYDREVDVLYLHVGEPSTAVDWDESPEGHHLRFGADGRIARFFPRDPSWTTWPALELLIHDNIVPDFPVCNKSVNGSYSGHDL